MGILSWFGLDSPVVKYAESQATPVLATPFSTSSLEPMFPATDAIFFRPNVPNVTRDEALSVPAVARGRHLISPVLARQPLKVYRLGVPIEPQPAWLSTSKYYPVRLRMQATLDDLIFEGKSLWVLDRGLPDSSGRTQILDAFRVETSRWFIQDGRIIVKGADSREIVVPEGDYILFPGMAPRGLLTMASRTIRGAINAESRWQEKLANPIALVELRYTGDDGPLDPEVMKDIRGQFIEARNDVNGTVMVTPGDFEVHTFGDTVFDTFVEARNAAAVDVARFLNMPTSMIDASQVNGSSVDYENNGIGRSAYYDLTLRSWALPIEEALSQDDVIAHGQYVGFDLTGLTTPDTGTGPVLED